MRVGRTTAAFWTSIPAGALLPPFPFTDPGPGGVSIINNPMDFDWEYVWHCHLLGHEENDMMRAISIQVAPAAPNGLVAGLAGANVALTWTNNETHQTGFSFVIQQASDPNFTTGKANYTVYSGTTNKATYGSTITLTTHGTYYFRVRAENKQGYSGWPNVVSVTY